MLDNLVKSDTCGARKNFWSEQLGCSKNNPKKGILQPSLYLTHFSTFIIVRNSSSIELLQTNTIGLLQNSHSTCPRAVLTHNINPLHSHETSVIYFNVFTFYFY